MTREQKHLSGSPSSKRCCSSHSLQLISYIYKLVKECVAMLDHLFPSNNLSISAECDGQNGVLKPAQSGGRVPKLEEIKYMQSLYMKSTVAALRSLKQIRSKSSTVKTD
ncbi:hypothetical protein ZIOFF_035416 [Zingiber officinale]|uniref:Uncharacterized protein n=1 Tax=Zingiber officinale TaxID=94328 RepID=A0A8J5L7M9_ZINOF|nr:hypothetical protein ZIOFF_035416 [Zingiber officinale]